MDMPGPRYFGDESGNFRGLLSGNEKYFGIGVVKGEATQCARCPKRAIRRASGVKEARWSDLTDVQRRRLVDCIHSLDGIDAAIAIIEPVDINHLTNSFVQQQDSFEYDNDMAILACLYGAAIAELGIVEEQRPHFTFDRCISQSASEQVCEILESKGFEGTIEHQSSTSVRGIQLADCIIGAATTDRYSGTDYLDRLPVKNITEYGLTVVEKTLDEFRAGP